MGSLKLVTPKVLRDAADRLHPRDGSESNGDEWFLCHAVRAVGGVAAAQEFTAFLLQTGELPAGAGALPMNDEPESARSAIRFMYAELLALALEDGCLP